MTKEQIELAKKSYMSDLHTIRKELESLLMVRVGSIDKTAVRKKIEELEKEVRFGERAELLKEEKIVTDSDLTDVGTTYIEDTMEFVRDRVDGKDRQKEFNEMLEEYKKNSSLFKIKDALEQYADRYDIEEYKKEKASQISVAERDIKKREISQSVKENVYDSLYDGLSEVRKKEEVKKATEELKKAYMEYQASMSGGKYNPDKKKEAEKLMNEYATKFDKSFDKTLFSRPADMTNVLEEIILGQKEGISLDIDSTADYILNSTNISKDLATNKYKIQIERCLHPRDEAKLRTVLEQAEKELESIIEEDKLYIESRKAEKRTLTSTIETIEKEDQRMDEVEQELEGEFEKISEKDKEEEIGLAVAKEYDEKGWFNKLKQRREVLGLKGLGLRHPLRSLMSLFGYGRAYAREYIAEEKEEEIDDKNAQIEQENEQIRARNEETRNNNNELRTDKDRIAQERDEKREKFTSLIEEEIFKNDGNISSRSVQETYEKLDETDKEDRDER